jgi:hypothetical protein
MTLEGKGFFTYLLPDCEGGDPTSILAAAQASGLSHVIVKIADGGEAFGINTSGIDLTARVVRVLRASGIAAWGWHSIHGIDPSAEAAIAIERAQALGLDGYVMKVENEYQNPGTETSARQFMETVRNALTIPIALSSHRFPKYHPELPWSTFLEFSDLHMPLITWEFTHEAGAQLCESRRQCDALPNARPFIPTGAAYSESGWSPSAEEILDFLTTAQDLGLPAINFFRWDTCRKELPLLWTAISDFTWPVPVSTTNQAIFSLPPVDAFLVKFTAALNSHQVEAVDALFDPSAVQVWADQIRNSAAAIQAGFGAFFKNLPTATIITISQAQSEGDWHLFSWKAGSLKGETTLVLKAGKIILDYTFIA